MTVTPPPLGLIDFGPYRDQFWKYRDVVTSVYTPGMTSTELLDEIRIWIGQQLLPYLKSNFSTLEVSWETQVESLVARVDTSIAEALVAIANADIPITDPVVYAVLITADTQVRTWLDQHYVSRATATRSQLTGWFHVDDFGAIGDGVAHDSAAIQAAIDAANALYVATGTVQRVQFSPRTYLCEATATQNPVYALLLKSGVELIGPGKLKVAPGSYWIGTDYALLRSPDEGIQEAAIRGLWFDGNRGAFNVPGGNTQASNIVLRTCNGVSITDVKSYSTAGMGIMVAGHSNNQSHDIIIKGCTVSGCGNIGIQVAQFDGLEIIDNDVSWTTDNGIDIYGEPESHNGAEGCKGVNFKISGNKIHDCGNGIFPETVARGLISNNHIRNVGEGIHVNRINAQPEKILITDNYIENCQSAVNCTGDTGGVTIRGNIFEWFNVGGVVFGGAGRVSNYWVLNNTMNANSDGVPLVLIRGGTDQAVGIFHVGTMTVGNSPDTVNFCTNNFKNHFEAAMRPTA